MNYSSQSIATEIEDERGRFGDDEAQAMQNIGIQVIRKPNVDQDAFVHKKQDHGFNPKSGYDWQYDDRITAITSGEEPAPESKADAMRLLRERFGCIYKSLSEEMRSDMEILFAATVESGGHALRHAPKDIVENLPARFFSRAMDEGIQDWVVERHASDAVKADPTVRKMVETIVNQRKKSAGKNDAST